MRGYIARDRDRGRIVGFAGAIPHAYMHQGGVIPALLGTTFRVLPRYARAGLSILMHMRDLGQRLMVVQTTPLPRLQDVLIKMGARALTQVTRRIYPLGAFASAQASFLDSWPDLPKDLRIVLHLDQVLEIARPESQQHGLHRAVSLAGLRWQLNSPMQRLRLLGAVDQSGRMTSYLLLRPARVLRFLDVWELVDAWSSRVGEGELYALTGALAADPTLLGRSRCWLSTVAFPSDVIWQGSPAVFQHRETVCHYYLLPPCLHDAQLSPVLAEGDLLL
ncbi:MAG: hypothetical protein LDL31_02080 [Prosthecobacter sp.]|jgi:hypothetical protein|nr:hypothetical protein [Prosthecobacter sp.]